ncbi:MAG TPA: hypothetical protein PLX97_03315, partial [Gemmatales bacterium]|nr:hypothetical protein [Gemmatales bacterium]
LRSLARKIAGYGQTRQTAATGLAEYRSLYLRHMLRCNIQGLHLDANFGNLRRFQAELVGQPTGGSPNHFGEVKRFQLPHSKCTVMYSTKKFVMTKDNATTVIPHRIITPTAKGFFADRDEALEAALLPQ